MHAPSHQKLIIMMGHPRAFQACLGSRFICNIDDHLSVAVPSRLFILDSGIAGEANRERTMGSTLTSFGGSALTLLADKALSRKLARLAVKPCINAWNSGVSATPLEVRELFDGSMMTVTLFRSAVRPTVIQSANLPAALALELCDSVHGW